MSAAHITVVEPPKGLSLDFREIWRYRELLYFLVWRDVKVRYKQTALGVGWALIQPVTAMLIFTLVFGRFAGIPSEGLPYPVFVFAGLLVWLYFSQAVNSSSQSVVASSSLLSKIYFPRLYIPAAAVAVPAIDFAIAGGVLVALMIGYGITPGWQVAFLPPLFLLTLLTAFGAGLWASALNVRYRDVPYAMPFLLQIWMYASPVVYPLELLPERWQWVFAANPMAGIIDGFRWALLDTAAPSWISIGVSTGFAGAIAISGLAYFSRVEQYFADVI